MTNYEFRHFINGIEVVPVGAENIGIKLDFMSDISEGELTTDTLKLTNAAYREVNMHVNSGEGLFEGIPYEIKVGSVTLEYFVNLTEGAIFADSYVECKIQKRWALSTFRDRARGLSFESLNANAPISGIFDIPYIIVPDNQIELFIMLSFATYQSTLAVIQATRDLITIITAGTVEASTPIVGVTPSVNAGAIASLILKIAAQTIYTLALILILVKLIKDIIELIVPKVRYLKGSKIKNLIEQGCTYLGYGFSSTLLDAIGGLTHLPVPLVKSNPSILSQILGNSTAYYNKGYPTASDTTPQLWDLIGEIRDLFNGKVYIRNKVVHLERRDFLASFASSSLVNTLNLQNIRENATEFNFMNTWKRYFMHYQFDPADLWTMDGIEGVFAEYSTEAINTTNADLVTIKNLAEIPSSFSLANRKKELNAVENSLSVLAIGVDNTINFLGGNSNLNALLLNRIGVTQISQQFFTVSKLMYTIGGKQPANFVDFIGMTAIYDNYHVINQVKENFKAIEKSAVPFAPLQFENMINNNFFFDQNGGPLEIRTFEWTSGAARASIEYQYPSTKAWNTKTVKIS